MFWWFGAIYGFVVALVVVTYVCVTGFITEYRMRLRTRLNSADDDASTILAEAIANFETIRNLDADGFEADRFDAVQARYEDAFRKHETSLKLLSFIQHTIVTLGLVSVMTLCVVEVIESKKSVGDLVLLTAYLLQIYLPLEYFGFVYREVRRSVLDTTSMFEMLNTEPEIVDEPNAADLIVHRGEIVFENVSFSYNSGRQVFRDFSLRIPPRSTYAIVGQTGSGKSTLARLLLRHFSPQKGRIKIDGQDIALVTRSSLRRALGVVSQETALFNETIGFNIGYGRRGYSEADLVGAARVAEVERFARDQPMGFDTRIGERGLRLSGGERQRLGIARVALANPPILILDEATSSLDAMTERRVEGALSDLAVDRTSIVIAHRLSTVTTADQIVVLRDGTIIDQGGHEELVRSGGAYSAMWRSYMREGDPERLNGSTM